MPSINRSSQTIKQKCTRSNKLQQIPKRENVVFVKVKVITCVVDQWLDCPPHPMILKSKPCGFAVASHCLLFRDLVFGKDLVFQLHQFHGKNFTFPCKQVSSMDSQTVSVLFPGLNYGKFRNMPHCLNIIMVV